MYFKKKIQPMFDINLAEAEKLVNIVDELNKSYVKTLERVKELEKKQSKLWETTGSLTKATLCYVDNNFNHLNEDGEIILPYNGKDYVIVADYRTTSLINRDTAIKVIEINKNGIQSNKYTSLNSLTVEEKKEYEKDGFIVIKIKEDK